MESWISNFSLRSRPCRKALRASSEEVVIRIFPAAVDSLASAVVFVSVLSATFEQPVRPTVKARIRESGIRMDLVRDIAVLLRSLRRKEVSRLASRLGESLAVNLRLLFTIHGVFPMLRVVNFF